jgi:hypothetical protein
VTFLFFGAVLAKRGKNGAKFQQTPFLKKVLDFFLQSKLPISKNRLTLMYSLCTVYGLQMADLFY